MTQIILYFKTSFCFFIAIRTRCSRPRARARRNIQETARALGATYKRQRARALAATYKRQRAR